MAEKYQASNDFGWPLFRAKIKCLNCMKVQKPQVSKTLFLQSQNIRKKYFLLKSYLFSLLSVKRNRFFSNCEAFSSLFPFAADLGTSVFGLYRDKI